MAKNTKQERDYVKALVRAMERKSPDYVIEIDHDFAGLRHKSKYDFYVSYAGYVVFVEAKIESEPLSDWQQMFRMRCARAGTRYVVLRFSASGKTFICTSINGVHRVADFRAEKFFAKGAK